MKKSFALLFAMVSLWAQAQYSTPGTGVIWNLDSLVTNSAGAVIRDGDNYEVTETVIIQPTDALNILENVTVLFHELTGIESSGILTIDAPVQAMFTAIDSTSVNKWNGIKLLSDHVTNIKNATFSFGGGMRVLTGTFSVDGSIFYKNFYNSDSYTSSAALDISGFANVTNCIFTFNQRGAIASGSNIACRANIRNNYIFGNTTENTNRPQINMGPSGPNDTTFIVGNTVIGNGSTNSGGIAYSSLVGMAGNVVIDSNFIDQNRYGLTLTGSPINGAVRYNTVTNNNIQSDPNLGGSGLNFTASSASSDLQAMVTGNIISGNHWGITIIGYPQVNMGDSALAAFNPGGNQFSDNGNNGILYDLYNNGPVAQTAMYNCWGVASQDAASIETVVFHVVDDLSLGRVTYMPSCAFQTVFNVQNESGLPLSGVAIAVENFDETLITDANGSTAAMLPPGNHLFTASLDGYNDFNGNYTVVPGINTVNIEMESSTPQYYTLTFQVNNPDGAPLETVTIEVDGQPVALQTNSEGMVSVELTDGIYNYTATLLNYEPNSGSVEIDGAAITEFIILYPDTTTLYTVTFFVDSNIGILDGVEITINDTLLITDNGGIAAIQLTNGTYPYIATAIDFSTVEGTVVVWGEDVEESVFLYTGTNDLLTQELSVYPNPVINRLYFNGIQVDEVGVYSTSGTLLMLFKTVDGFIDLGRLEAGSYLLRIYSGNKLMTKLIVKQ